MSRGWKALPFRPAEGPTSTDFEKINRHSPYLSITLPKYYQYYL